MTSAQDAAEVFRATRPTVHSALLLYFGLSERDCIEAEAKLFQWSRRFVLRHSCDQLSKRTLTKFLVMAACQYGRSLQTSPDASDGADPARRVQPEYLAVASALASELDRELTSW